MTMALTTTEEASSRSQPSEPVVVPVPEADEIVVNGRIRKRPRKKKGAREGSTAQHSAPVATTPCDPWPRPYYFEHGFRRVKPYFFTYNTWCKERWRGMPILEVFRSEFRDRDHTYYVRAIETGNVHLNGKPVLVPETLVKNGDLISHTLHRHEPPVTSDPIGVVHESDDMIVINKPAGVPVHPAGRYNYNSVTEILRAERGFGFNPLPCNRLDRLTSGIMFIAKHRAAADRMMVQLTERSVRKEYVARVKGEFPADEEVVCDQPILQISPKLGLNQVRANGKASRTVFKRLAYYPPEALPESKLATTTTTTTSTPKEAQPAERRSDGYSIVRARPLTGRTHQIRVHLQYLGHPIANDPIYSNARVFGPTLGAACSTGENDESIMERLARMGKDEVAEAVAWHDEQVDDYERRKAEKLSGERCPVCATELYTDPAAREMSLWLHARKYEAADGAWGYETALPAWALPPGQREQVAAEVKDVEGNKDTVVGDLQKALEETAIKDDKITI